MIYSILDPTGNITALVESTVPVSRQPEAAAGIMARHPEVEQVGFVTFTGFTEQEPSAAAHLRMAGGEFCGNASMCAAALYRIRKGMGETGHTVLLSVSGAAGPVEVHVRPAGGDLSPAGTAAEQAETGVFRTDIRMPEAAGIEEVPLRYEHLDGVLPLVRMQGISHILIEEASPFFIMRQDRTMAEEAAVRWCRELQAEGLGLMFLQRTEDNGAMQEYRLTPLVCVPGSSTVFWENSCASGSSAAGMYLVRQAGGAVKVRFREPGGCLTVESSGLEGVTRLFGQVRLTGTYNLPDAAGVVLQ